MTSWSAADMPAQTGRTAVVTGANSGLGLHTSIGLARKGARVLLACRDAGRAAVALDRVRAQAPEASVEVVLMDLASLASIEVAANEIAERIGVLDLLVDNAGIMAPPRAVTVDGFEAQFGTNHLGHFALTGRLLPLLLRSAAPRVVVVSSGAHRMGRIRFDDLQGERSYKPWAAYGQSKLANLLFARELQRRAARTALLVAAAHPGYAATHLQRDQGSILRDTLMKLGNATLAQSDANGALPSLYAATMPDVGPGDYWGPSLFELRGVPKQVGRSKTAQDDEVAHRLWHESTRLTGVSYALPA